MQATEMREWVIQKRVANTDHWGTVARRNTRDEAIQCAKEVVGGASTGVRILPPDPYAAPEIVRGV